MLVCYLCVRFGRGREIRSPHVQLIMCSVSYHSYAHPCSKTVDHLLFISCPIQYLRVRVNPDLERTQPRIKRLRNGSVCCFVFQYRMKTSLSFAENWVRDQTYYHFGKYFKRTIICVHDSNVYSKWGHFVNK